jgi:hypothetical protein
MLTILLFLLVIGATWLAAVLVVVWLLLREQNCETPRNLSVSELIVQAAQGRRVWCSVKAWLASKPLRLTHQPVTICPVRSDEPGARRP